MHSREYLWRFWRFLCGIPFRIANKFRSNKTKLPVYIADDGTHFAQSSGTHTFGGRPRTG
jgi:hypothetical protein